MRRLLRGVIGAIGVLVFSGCGTQGVGIATVVSTKLADGRPVFRFGFGAEGGAQPALVARSAGGFALVYVGTRPRDRHLYLSTSPDGQTWLPAQRVADGEFSDQSPALLEDEAGQLHLYFVSNRSGLNQAVYHATLTGHKASEPVIVPGMSAAQRVAVARMGEEALVLAEVVGAGIVAYRGRPGGGLSALSSVAQAGAEPAVCALGDGRVAVAFQREGKIIVRAGHPGVWGEEIVAADATTRLRDPALHADAEGMVLAYAERHGAGNMQLRLRAFDESFKFRTLEMPGIGSGESRGATFAVSPQGLRLLAWGMKTTDGQQGVMVTRH